VDAVEERRHRKAFLPNARRIVNKIDPLDLVKMGASKDEYEALVDHAASCLARGATDLDVQLAQFVRRHYGVPPDKARIAKLAAELRAAWQKSR
jgi:hypothetical protein